MLCRPNSAFELAIMRTITRVVDEILYTWMGHGGVRVTMKELINPSTSIIIKPQGKLTHLMADWSAEVEGWYFLVCFGAQFEDRGFRLMTWGQCLKKRHGGKFEYFELRLAGLLYKLIRMCCDSTAAEEAGALVSEFLAEPMECFLDSCRRLRECYPTEAALLQALPHAMDAFGEHLVCGIDGCERSHGQMRVGLRSDGRATNLSISGTRVFCRQLAAAHAAIGGSLEPPIHPRGAARADAAHRKRSSRYDGSPILRFINAKRHRFKQIYAQHRPFTWEELNRMRQSAKAEWDQLSDEQNRMWVRLNQAEGERRRRTAVEEQSGEAARLCCGLWASSQDRCHCLSSKECMHVLMPDDVFEDEGEKEEVDDDDVVRAPVPALCRDVPRSTTCVYG